MRTMLVGALAALMLTFGASEGFAYSHDVSVRGYTRKDGTYVSPYRRTRPDSSLRNNYSTRGNTNPYTGRRGTVSPYRTYQPRYNSRLGSSLYGKQRRRRGY